jgi:hypothetical protein
MGPRNKISRFIPCNPLKSLGSHERIQGNPKKSNPRQRGFCGKRATRQENPNESSDPTSPTAEVIT